MSYQALIDDFLSVLNRDDCTETQADTFLRQGIARLQRDVRLPCMEREMDTTISTAGTSFIVLPSDLLQIIDVFVTDSNSVNPRALTKKSYREVMAVATTEIPKVYGRYQNVIKIAGTLGVGAIVTILYYGSFSSLTSWSADNEVTLGFADVAVYGALPFAADSFNHPSMAAWEQRYVALRDAIKGEAIDLEMTGGPQEVATMYSEAYP